MNRTEKIICILLGAVLAWYIFGQSKNRPQQPQPVAQPPAVQEVQPSQAAPAAAEAKGEAQQAALEQPKTPSVPEETVVLENDELKLELSSWGAVVKKATLKKYAKDCGEISEENPAVEFDFSASPLGRLGDIDGSDGYEIKAVEASKTSATFSVGGWTRKVTLGDGYLVTYEDKCQRDYECGNAMPSTLSLGQMRMGDSKNDLLSVDSWAMDAGKGKEGVVHHCEGSSPLKELLVGGLSGGCSGSKNAVGMPLETTVPYIGAQKWIALKNRFFVTALVSTTAENAGFSATVSRDAKAQTYRPESVSAVADVKTGAGVTKSVFYIGPKKQSLLWNLGMKDVMEFGMWRWICYPLVWVLNFFNSLVPNYGIAIILLTILVRLIFWPLTHKSTVGMKKMQELQPKMKEIQAKFKDNPQRLQQETWALYRENKVNPMSSCLPMLVQIPVFIALFNVLRSAVELRYASFLWISDLSEPEALFSSWFPFGGLNLLPILMAATTALQSAFTPSAGDRSQQRMMMVFMPLMMLVMFYSFPSALSLYWFLSNVFSIVQMWIIRRQTAAKGDVLVPEVIDPPVTRQMRRHG